MGCASSCGASARGLSAAQFAAIHRVFGASNVSKLLRHVQAPRDRGDAVMAVAHEAQARVSDPIYGCVGCILALQQTVVINQSYSNQSIHAYNQFHVGGELAAAVDSSKGTANSSQLREVGERLASRARTNHQRSQPAASLCGSGIHGLSASSPPQSSLNISSGLAARQEMQYCMLQDAAKALVDAGELQALAFRMMGY